MGISGFRIRYLLGITLLSLVFLSGFPVKGEEVNPRTAPTQEPEAFRKLGARVMGLRFYSTETPQAIPMQARVYKTSFSGADRFIWWELCLDTKAKRDAPVRLIFYVTWKRPDGTEFYQSETAVLPPGIQQPCLAAGFRDKRPDAWIPGSYEVVIMIEDKIVAKGSFDVSQKIFQEN